MKYTLLRAAGASLLLCASAHAAPLITEKDIAASATPTVSSMTLTGTGNAFTVSAGSITVVGQLNIGWEHVTNSCGSAVTTCTATCSANKLAFGGGCISLIALIQDSGTNISHICATLSITTLTADVYCMRVGP